MVRVRNSRAAARLVRWRLSPGPLGRRIQDRIAPAPNLCSCREFLTILGTATDTSLTAPTTPGRPGWCPLPPTGRKCLFTRLGPGAWSAPRPGQRRDRLHQGSAAWRPAQGDPDQGPRLARINLGAGGAGCETSRRRVIGGRHGANSRRLPGINPATTAKLAFAEIGISDRHPSDA